MRVSGRWLPDDPDARSKVSNQEKELNLMACPIPVPLKECRWLRFAFTAIVGRPGFAGPVTQFRPAAF